MSGKMCPMRVPGTQVSAVDTPDGAALVFTTSGELAELRQRVHKMAAMHEHKAAGGMAMGSRPGMMKSHGMMKSRGMMKLVPSSARAEDIDAGTRIVVVPKHPAQREELRAQVRAYAARLAGGQCPMMGHGA